MEKSYIFISIKLNSNNEDWPDKSDLYLVRKDGNLCYREIVKGILK